MPDERFMMLQLHDLLMYLGQRGVLTILVMAEHGVWGSSRSSPVDVSYLADTVILIRYFETQGAVRKAISVLKKRTGGHERTIRGYDITPAGLHIGEPLEAFRGILAGVPSEQGGGEVAAP